MDPKQYAGAVEALVKQLRPVLAGHPPEVQSGAIADCLATFLAGHVVRGDPKGTKKLRERILSAVIVAVHKLIEPNAKEIGTWQE